MSHTACSFLLLVVILRAPNGGVLRYGRADPPWREGLVVEAMLEDRRDTLIGIGLQRERPLTGRFEAVPPIGFAEPSRGARGSGRLSCICRRWGAVERVSQAVADSTEEAARGDWRSVLLRRGSRSCGSNG